MNYYCHCRAVCKGKYIDTMVKAQPRLTIVDSNGICFHCGYYALQSIPMNETRASTNKQNLDNAELQLTLLEQWRMQRGDDVSA